MIKKIALVATLIVIGAFGYYALSPLFRNVEVNESAPVVQTSSPDATDAEQATTTDPLLTGPQPITDTVAHPASGTARVTTDGVHYYVRYEDFKTINGPDIYVYLSKDLDANEYVSLGRVKATEGNVNYQIPDDINPEEYPYVLVWCRAFGVLFNSAKLY